MLSKGKINSLILSLIGVVSLTSCSRVPSNSVGFTLTGYYHHNIAYIYPTDKDRYTFGDELTLDLYYGFNDYGNRRTSNPDNYILLYFDYSYEVWDLPVEEFEGDGYTHLDSYGLYFIKEIQVDDFYSLDYQFEVTRSMINKYTYEFNHHEDIKISSELLNKILVYEMSGLSISLINAYKHTSGDETFYVLDTLCSRSLNIDILGGYLYFI